MGQGHQLGEHSHLSPHGGQVVSAGKYHFELVVHEGEMHLYPFSEDMTPLPVKGIIGNIDILVRGQVSRRAELKPGSDALEATIDLAGVRKFIAAVTLVIDGKALTPRFSIDFRAHHRSEQGASEADASHAHHRAKKTSWTGFRGHPTPFEGRPAARR